MLLTIAIPTYNRANRLNKCLADLYFELNNSIYKSDINVLVCNNGSLDNTLEVISKHVVIFRSVGINFFTASFDMNQGFDSNVQLCYQESNSEYVWFLSDDDNIKPGVIDHIISDINNFQPSIIYYNHEQFPYTLQNPYITDKIIVNPNSLDIIFLLNKLVKWPKLSSYVLKKNNCLSKVENLNAGFHHVSLALECALSKGNVLLSPTFNASPDADYLENIDFPPYIGNGLNKVILNTLKVHDLLALYDELALSRTDPLISSLNTLGAYYRGKHVLTLSLRKDLWEKVNEHLKLELIMRLIDFKLLKELIKFLISLCYSFLFTIISGKQIRKIRPSPSDAELL
jgi:glycosyltransferase involved in cell wall biosynthesis